MSIDVSYGVGMAGSYFATDSQTSASVIFYLPPIDVWRATVVVWSEIGEIQWM